MSSPLAWKTSVQFREERGVPESVVLCCFKLAPCIPGANCCVIAVLLLLCRNCSMSLVMYITDRTFIGDLLQDWSIESTGRISTLPSIDIHCRSHTSGCRLCPCWLNRDTPLGSRVVPAVSINAKRTKLMLPPALVSSAGFTLPGPTFDTSVKTGSK